jgi:hypothetical protein
MQQSATTRTIIRASQVRHDAHPVLVESGEGRALSPALSVVPMMDGNTVAGIEVRCGCGSIVLIECVYPEVPSPQEEDS